MLQIASTYLNIQSLRVPLADVDISVSKSFMVLNSLSFAVEMLYVDRFSLMTATDGHVSDTSHLVISFTKYTCKQTREPPIMKNETKRRCEAQCAT